MGRPASSTGLSVTELILIAALAVLPWLGIPVYFVSFMFTLFLYVCLASSWSIIGGLAGYLSFGHAAFLGIGAYSTAIIAKALDLSPLGTLFSVIPAGAVSALIALVIGYPCLRLRGPYFAVITLCFGFVAQLAVKNLAFTGGADGLWLKAMDLPIHASRSVSYEMMLLLTVLTVFTAGKVWGSKFGAGLRAIKEDEEVAQTMAINAPKLKLTAFVISAFFPGMCGGIFACYLTYIHPDIVFDVNISILIVLMALFGGGNHRLGAVVGAASLTLVNEGLSTFVKAESARIIYGCLFVAVIIFMPNGIIEYLGNIRSRSGETHR
ncbi:MAG: branched-chain amino acid ABC transporter permease [Pseudomonadota bacterium]